MILSPVLATPTRSTSFGIVNGNSRAVRGARGGPAGARRIMLRLWPALEVLVEDQLQVNFVTMSTVEM